MTLCYVYFYKKKISLEEIFFIASIFPFNTIVKDTKKSTTWRATSKECMYVTLTENLSVRKLRLKFITRIQHKYKFFVATSLPSSCDIRSWMSREAWICHRMLRKIRRSKTCRFEPGWSKVEMERSSSPGRNAVNGVITTDRRSRVYVPAPTSNRVDCEEEKGDGSLVETRERCWLIVREENLT